MEPDLLADKNLYKQQFIDYILLKTPFKAKEIALKTILMTNKRILNSYGKFWQETKTVFLSKNHQLQQKLRLEKSPCMPIT